MTRKLKFLLCSERTKNNHYQKKVAECGIELSKEKTFCFCEYYFDVASLSPYFQKSSFSIIKTMPIDFLWGEFGFLINRFKRNKMDSGASIEANSLKVFRRDNISSRLGGIIRNVLYDFFVTENRENIFFRVPLALLNYLSGHLILFVAKAI